MNSSQIAIQQLVINLKSKSDLYIYLSERGKNKKVFNDFILADVLLPKHQNCRL
jgi:hypothetical protein